MTTSESIAKIAPALLAAQRGMGDVIKNSVNPAFKSTYADLGAVNKAALPALHAAGIAVLQAPGGDGETMSVTTRLVHESGEWIESTVTLRPSKNDPQGAGSAITYGRRYALLAMCALDAEDDDGNDASKKAGRKAEGGPVDAGTDADHAKANANILALVQRKAIPLPRLAAFVSDLSNGAHVDYLQLDLDGKRSLWAALKKYRPPATDGAAAAS